MEKGFLQISFAWLFALIVGAFILFIAIFASTKFINTEQTTQDAAVAKDISTLLNPLETGFESGKKTLLDLPIETRIYSECEVGGFGYQRIKVSQKSLGKWTDTNLAISIQDRYIFEESPAEGKQFYILSFPFEFPFKVADVLIIIPKDKNYCFVNPPEEHYKPIADLNLSNVENVSQMKDCEGSVSVCWSGSCDILIDEGDRYVRKDNEKVFYETDALKYAAIFSDPALYECQVKRLMARVENLADLYSKKASFVAQKGCNSNVDFQRLISDVQDIHNNPSLISTRVIKNDIETIKNTNDRGICQLW